MKQMVFEQLGKFAAQRINVPRDQFPQGSRLLLCQGMRDETATPWASRKRSRGPTNRSGMIPHTLLAAFVRALIERREASDITRWIPTGGNPRGELTAPFKLNTAGGPMRMELLDRAPSDAASHTDTARAMSYSFPEVVQRAARQTVPIR